MPQVAVLFERGRDERLETRRYQRVDVADRLGRAVEDRVEDNRLRAPTEGLGPGRHFVEHDAEGKEVGAGVHLLATRLLGRHV